MTLFRFRETVVACESCGFAGLVEVRQFDWAKYQLATREVQSVQFAFCSSCGVTCAVANEGGLFSIQPRPLQVTDRIVRLAAWLSTDVAPDESGRCPSCGCGNCLVRRLFDVSAIQSVCCPICWSSLKVTDVRAEHPRW